MAEKSRTPKLYTTKSSREEMICWKKKMSRVKVIIIWIFNWTSTSNGCGKSSRISSIDSARGRKKVAHFRLPERMKQFLKISATRPYQLDSYIYCACDSVPRQAHTKSRSRKSTLREQLAVLLSEKLEEEKSGAMCGSHCSCISFMQILLHFSARDWGFHLLSRVQCFEMWFTSHLLS